MTGLAWPLVELVSRPLEPEEREAVLGDLLEADRSAWQALLDIFGLILRRQAFSGKIPSHGLRDSVWRSRAPTC